MQRDCVVRIPTARARVLARSVILQLDGRQQAVGMRKRFAVAHRACCAEYPYFVFSVLCARDMGEAREALRSCK